MTVKVDDVYIVCTTDMAHMWPFNDLFLFSRSTDFTHRHCYFSRGGTGCVGRTRRFFFVFLPFLCFLFLSLSFSLWSSNAVEQSNASSFT